MKKNKKMTPVLFFAVLMVWGLVFYRFFSWREPAVVEPLGSGFAGKDFAFRPKDTFGIQLSSRDPFLGSIANAASKTKTLSAPRTFVKKKVEKIATPWPSVAYKGLVASKDNGKKIYVLDINGKTYMLRTGQSEGNIKLVNGTAKEVLVAFSGEKKTILLN